MKRQGKRKLNVVERDALNVLIGLVSLVRLVITLVIVFGTPAFGFLALYQYIFIGG